MLGKALNAPQHLNPKSRKLELTQITAQKMKFSVKDFFSKCEKIRRKLRICPHLLIKILNGKLFLCSE